MLKKVLTILRDPASQCLIAFIALIVGLPPIVAWCNHPSTIPPIPNPTGTSISRSLPTATNTSSAVVVTPSPVVPTPTPTPTPYSATEPGFHCDSNGGVWSARPQNIDGVNCPNATGTQLVINTSGTRGYLYFQQLPHNQPFSSNNAVSITGVLGGTASGYATKCVGLAEQDTNTGYLVEYCNTGAWFVASISGGGGILNKLETGTIAAETTAKISFTLEGGKLSFSIDGNEPNNVIDTTNISSLQPIEVAIVYDCVGYGAYQAIGGNYLLVHDFSYTALS